MHCLKQMANVLTIVGSHTYIWLLDNQALSVTLYRQYSQSTLQIMNYTFQFKL